MDRDEAAVELVRQPHPPRPRIKLSSSLAKASRDEFVCVGAKGEVQSPWRHKLLYGTGFVAMGMLGAGFVFSLLSGFMGIAMVYAVGGAFSGTVWWRMMKLRRGAALMAANRLDEAELIFTELTRQRLSRRLIRGLAWQNLAGLEVRRGRHAMALEHARRCRQVLGRKGGAWQWINRFSELLLLAQLGRLEEARILREELASAPDGEYFRIMKITADLMLAFAEGRTERLPEDLFDWSRTALETTTAELALALLAWAHLDRGDVDMGEHLLESAWDRIDRERFAIAHPQVWRWLRSVESVETGTT